MGHPCWLFSSRPNMKPRSIVPMQHASIPPVKGLALLLEHLDPDQRSTASKYEHLVNTLTTFCEHRLKSPVHADDIVRRTVDILSLKLSEGEPIANLRAYAFAVARHLLSDYRKTKHPEYLDEAIVNIECRNNPAGDDAMERELMDECRWKCLQSLPQSQRDLITRYYREGLHCKSARMQMAEELNITPEALANRISRIRKKLIQRQSRYLAQMRRRDRIRTKELSMCASAI